MAPQLFSIAVYKCTSNNQAFLLLNEQDLSSFNFLLRKNANQVLTFCSRTVAERTDPSATGALSITYQGYFCHGWLGDNGLFACVITNEEYPQSAAINAAKTVLVKFRQTIPSNRFASIKADAEPGQFVLPSTSQWISEWQNPDNVSKLTKINKQLEETKSILVKNIDSLLKVNEDLESIANKSQDLNAASKTFVRTAQQTNRCPCSVM